MPYVLQSAHKSHCPTCGETVALLCEKEDHLNTDDFVWFYICFVCESVSQVGVGEVEDIRDEGEP